MTARAETRFDCDRCGDTINVPLQNTPVTQRAPEGWAAIVINYDRNVHLCFDCASALQGFLDKAK